MKSAEELQEALAAPFDPSEVKWKPGATSGNRAMAMAYVDARVIQDRLDDVLGLAGWQDEFVVLPDNSVLCRLKLHINGVWITKEDVGSPSEQPDQGDRMKAAVSDALKRAAVKFGLGRYLYRLGGQWVDYDPQKRRFLKQPQLPADAIPQRKPALPEQPHKKLSEAATRGTEALQSAWNALTPEQRKANQHFLESLKKQAAEASDAAA